MALPGEGQASSEPADGPSLDMVTAALRADSADVAIYARVLTESLGDALPPGCVTIDRDAEHVRPDARAPGPGIEDHRPAGRAGAVRSASRPGASPPRRSAGRYGASSCPASRSACSSGRTNSPGHWWPMPSTMPRRPRRCVGWSQDRRRPAPARGAVRRLGASVWCSEQCDAQEQSLGCGTAMTAEDQMPDRLGPYRAARTDRRGRDGRRLPGPRRREQTVALKVLRRSGRATRWRGAGWPARSRPCSGCAAPTWPR